MPKLVSNKDMNLDIPLHFSNPNKIPLKKWTPPSFINQEWNTEKCCTLCCGAKVVGVNGSEGQFIKYCPACKGLGRIFVKSENEVITA